MSTLSSLTQSFCDRHIGVHGNDERHMLQTIGVASRQALIDRVVPAAIKRPIAMQLPAAASEREALAELRAIADKNVVLKSMIGQGYYGCETPTVILRNVLENPAWYTAYTPYQAEISQGRLEAVLNFQTMVCDLTAMPIANGSLLDEATAGAEAMAMARRVSKSKSNTLVLLDDVLPQTEQVIRTRAKPLGIAVRVCRASEAAQVDSFAVLVQYPSVDGEVGDHRDWLVQYKLKNKQALVLVAADLLALALLVPPGEWGADIVFGSSQRFGMPMGCGGPHAAYMACREAHKRAMPGRLVGASVDAHGTRAYRLALQTREQHIRREKATSNICTAQVLPAVVASMYAVYHGADGLRQIAQRVAVYTGALAAALQKAGHALRNGHAFDTLTVETGGHHTASANAMQTNIVQAALDAGINLRIAANGGVGISLDETTHWADVQTLARVFGAVVSSTAPTADAATRLPAKLQRTSAYLTHPTFHRYRSETAMLRYLRMLSDKDLALDRTMIPLGSCTMKLNATSEMLPITWEGFAHIHPFAPAEQQRGYAELAQQLEGFLCQATGYAAVSLQPNAGSQGEFAGLLAIKAYHEARGDTARNICLIPASAHGTNPASAHMAGMKVVLVKCDTNGNVDMDDLRQQCEKHSNALAAIMITYPSTHGVFETGVRDLCALVHQHGGRVYVDGANMNALVGLAAPGAFGGDVSHLNLHKTFCIPHGGGGPGVGPVCVVEDLVPYLPSTDTTNPQGKVGAISAARFGNAAVLPISWMYCRMMGADGLQAATEVAILNANYISRRLAAHYPTLYASEAGDVAHECILDLRPIKESCGITAEDVAKRLIDYGFHAPTLSFPVAGTLMVEPTESEDLGEMNRFIDAMIAIREEIAYVENGTWSKEDNPLRHAPHTASHVIASEWKHAYSRETAAAMLGEQQHSKYWTPVGRVDNVYGDRNLFCTCPPMGDYENQE